MFFTLIQVIKFPSISYLVNLPLVGKVKNGGCGWSITEIQALDIADWEAYKPRYGVLEGDVERMGVGIAGKGE